MRKWLKGLMKINNKNLKGLKFTLHSCLEDNVYVIYHWSMSVEKLARMYKGTSNLC